MRKNLRTAAVLAVLASLLLIAVRCGNDDETTPSPSASPSGTKTGTPGTPVPAGSAPPTDEPFSGARTPVQVVATPSVIQAHLKAVRVAELVAAVGEADSSLVMLQDSLLVAYVKPPILADPSGKEVTIDGKAFLQITIQGAVANYLAAGGTAYSGPNELKPGLPNLAEAELTGDFEAVLTWVLGVNEEADFRVLTLDSPARLVVDVGHP